MKTAAKQMRSAARRSQRIAAPASDENQARLDLSRNIMEIEQSWWVDLAAVAGLPGIPGTVAELRARLLAEGWTVQENRYSPDYQLSYECLLTALPAATLQAYLAKLRLDRAERKAAAEALARFKSAGGSIFARAETLVGLPGLPDNLVGVKAWCRQKGYITGGGADADFLPPAALQEWVRRAEAAASAKALEQASSARQLAELEAFLDVEAARAVEPAPDGAPEPWALLSVLSKVALAQLAGKGVRLTADQTAILFAHLEERSAA